MPDYLDLEINVDASTLYEEALDTVQALAPEDWEPSEIEQWILQAVARMAVEIAVLAGNVPLRIFQYFGESVLQIAPESSSPATGDVTFTLIDDAGHAIDAGTELTIDGFGFRTDAALPVPNGASVGAIGITAIEAGTDANDLAGDVAEVVAPKYLFIDNVQLNAPTAGGTDGETGQEYADRIADELPTLSPKAILIEDFEIIARRNPLVGRVLAIDLYDADTADDDAEGHVTDVVQGVDGLPLDEDTRLLIKADLEANRVLGIVVHVIDATYSRISVWFAGDAYDEFDSAAVDADAVAAITDYLDPRTWGRPDFGDTERWVNETTVYRADLIGVARNVVGMRHITDLKLGIGKAITAVTATDIFTHVAHGYANADELVFDDLTGGAALVEGTRYYARDVTANTFKIAAAPGGAALDIGTDITAGYVAHLAAVDIVMPGVAPLPITGSVSGDVT